MISRNKFPGHHARKSSGFTMVELLVAMVVLSIGVLAAAALQLKAMQYSSESSLRTQAAYLSQEVVDRIRSDSSATATSYEDIECLLQGGNVVCNRSGAAINPASTLINDQDVLSWGDRVSRSHPQGRVRVCHGTVTNNATGAYNCDESGNVWTVTVMWDEGRSGAAGLNCTPDTTVDLQCYQVSFVKLP